MARRGFCDRITGPEFVAAAILRWLADAGIDTALIDPGKPWQNATDEFERLRQIRFSQLSVRRTGFPESV